MVASVRFAEHPDGRIRFSTDRSGHRTNDVPFQKPADTIRIAILGDSHTNGIGVHDEERFSNLLEDLFNGLEAGSTYEIINLGHPGDTTLNYESKLQEALSYQVDMVIVVVYSGNDLGELAQRQTMDEATEQRPTANALKIRLRRLHFYHLLAGAMFPSDVPTYLGFSPCRVRYEADTYGLFQQTYEQACLFDSGAFDLNTTLSRHQRALRSMSQRADSSSAELVVFYLPPQILVDQLGIDPSGRDKVLDQLGMSPTQVVTMTREIHGRLQQATDTAGVHTVDLRAAFDQAQSDSIVYYPKDGHLTSLGHAAVSEYMFKVLRAMPSARAIPMETPFD